MIVQLPLRSTFVSPKSGITLTVCGGSFGHADEADVLSGKAPRIEMRATQDGRGIIRNWHHELSDGPETESVWAEVWIVVNGVEVCDFHGTVDRESRRITQVG